MFDWILNASELFVRYGLSPTTAIMFLIYFLKQRKVRRRLRKYLPWLIADEESEVRSYVQNQITIMENQRRMMEGMGLEWNGPEASKPITAMNLKKSYQLSWGVIRMKNKLKSRKFCVAILGAVLVIANETFDLGLSAESQATIVVILVSFILGESAVDAKRAGKEKSNDDDFTTPIEPRI